MDETTWHGQMLDGKDFHGANLRDATFEGCSLVGADLSGADLRNARFIDCDMRRANLEQASMAGAVFSRSWLTGARGLLPADRTRIRQAGGWFLVAV